MGNGTFGLVILVLVGVIGFAWAARAFGGNQKRSSTDSSDGGSWIGGSAGWFSGLIGSSEGSGSHESGSSLDSSSSDSSGSDSGGGGSDGGGD